MSYTLYSMQSSGNCYKPRLLMHQLGIDFRLVDIDSGSGETRTPEFLALNPNGRVPLLVLPDGRRLSESNAMLVYLAEGTGYLPADRYDRAICNQWLFFEQYEHEPTVAVARSWITVYPERRGKASPEQIADWHKRGYRALGVMEQRLAGARLARRRCLFRRRHRPLCLHPRRRRGRLRPHALSCHPGLARSRGGRAGLRGDRLAASLEQHAVGAGSEAQARTNSRRFTRFPGASPPRLPMVASAWLPRMQRLPF